MNKVSQKEYKNHNKKQHISEFMMLKIKQTNEQKLFRKVYLKFLILRVRAKISFMAL